MNNNFKPPPQSLRKYFWEINFDVLDFKKNSEYVIARILEYGDIEAIAWIFKNYDKKEIKKVLIHWRDLSKRTGNFWSKILDIDKNEIQCLNKSYQKMQKTHWPY